MASKFHNPPLTQAVGCFGAEPRPGVVEVSAQVGQVTENVSAQTF